MRWVRRAARLTRRDWSLLLWALARVARYRIALWWVPATALVPRAGGTSRMKCSRERAAWAVKVAARFVPAATCLTQALALQSLLLETGHPSTIRIGVAKDNKGFAAHAWVESGAHILIGGGERDRYTPLLAWEGRR
jgi:hypothetical protein